jgi:hypothetical protein
MTDPTMADLPVRRGGTVHLADGRRGLWSVAEGRRGRRWRWALLAGRLLEASYLLEVDREGHLTRLEGATAGGLLTLHPDSAERRLHGNVVTASGIRHLDVPWAPGAFVDLVADPLFPGILVAAVGPKVPVGSEGRVPVLAVDPFWRHRTGTLVVAHLTEEGWEVRPADEGWPRGPWTGELRRDGLPAFPGGADWELELATR